MLDSVTENPSTTAEQAQLPEPKGPAGYAQICLLGRPPLSRFLECTEDTLAEGARLDRPSLIEEWRAASDYYHELERSEAGIADQEEHQELDPRLAAVAAELTSHPSFRCTFDTLPTRLGMVELDRLIVHQWRVTLDFIDQVKDRIGPAPDPAALFGICMPLQPSEMPIQVQRLGSRRFAFRCESEDFDLHEPELLKPKQAGESFALAGVIGLALGFGWNFLSAVRVGNRVLLNNGYHRACALRALGITHAPCAIEMAAGLDELQLTVNSRVAEEVESYLQSARPPLLKDFFDPRIRKVLPIRKLVRHIEVEFLIRDSLIPG
jgi:hypothetical protein